MMMQAGRFVCYSFCLLCMSMITGKVISWFYWTWCYDLAHQSEELINFVRDLVPDMDSESLFHFSHHFRDFMRFISISHTVTGRFLWHSAKRNDADKIMNWQHLGTDPSDIWIRIRSNQEIWIRIPDHLWLRLDALAEVCALWVQSNFCLQLVRGIF